MATVIDSLMVTLGLDAKDVKKGMAEASKTIDSGVKNILSNVIAPLAGAFAVGKLFGNYLSEADTLGKMAASLGVNVRELDAWSQAAEHAGGSASGLQGSLAAVGEKMVAATQAGGKASAEIFGKLGVKIKDAEGKMRSSTDVLADLATAADRMGKTEFTANAKKLGVDQGTIMLLQSGREATDNLVGSLRELSYTEEDARVTADFKDSIQDMGKSFQLLAAIAFREVLPALKWVSDRLQGGANELRKYEVFVKAALVGVATVIALTVIPTLLSMAAAWLLTPFPYIIGAILLLAAVFEDFWIYLNGGEAALDGFWSLLGDGPALMASLAAWWETLKVAGTMLWEDLKKAAKSFFGDFEAGLEPVKEAFRKVLEFIKILFTGDMYEAGAAAEEAFFAVATALEIIFEKLFEKIKKAFQAVWAEILGTVGLGEKGFFNDTFGGLGGKLHEAVEGAQGAERGRDAASFMDPELLMKHQAMQAAKAANVYNETRVGDIYVTSTATNAADFAADILNQLAPRLAVTASGGVNQ